MARRLPSPLAPLALLLLAACAGGADRDVRSTGEPSSGPRFEAADAGATVAYSGPTWGLAVGDVDGDGWLDLYSSQHGSPPALYRNLGGRFEDATPRVDQDPRGDSHGGAWADFDNDGDRDLLQLIGAGRGEGRGPNRLLVNTGQVLIDEAERRGLDDPLGRGRMPVWLDWNGDGWLDVAIANAPREGAPSRLFLSDGAHFRAAEPEGFGSAQAFGLALHEGAQRLLVIERGGTKLLDLGSSGGPSTPVTGALPGDWASGDFNGDGIADLVISRVSTGGRVRRLDERRMQAHLPIHGEPLSLEIETEGPLRVDLRPSSRRWWQPHHVRLGAAGVSPRRLPFSIGPEEASGRPRVATESSGGAPEDQRSVDVWYDPETGRWQLAADSTGREVLNVEITSETPIGAVELRPSEGGRIGWVRLLAGPDFARIEDEALGAARDCGALAPGDFDNDGDLDLYLLCGRPGDNLPDRVLENRGDGTFVEIEGARPGTDGSGTADRAVVLDFDRDGRLDLVVTNGAGLRPFNRGPIEWLRNTGPSGHWLAVDLVGAASSRDAIGAVVHLESTSGRQMRLRGAETRGGSQDQPLLHFGLGASERATVTVDWPSGARQRLEDLPADRVLVVYESH